MVFGDGEVGVVWMVEGGGFWGEEVEGWICLAVAVESPIEKFGCWMIEVDSPIEKSGLFGW